MTNKIKKATVQLTIEVELTHLASMAQIVLGELSNGSKMPSSTKRETLDDIITEGVFAYGEMVKMNVPHLGVYSVVDAIRILNQTGYCNPEMFNSPIIKEALESEGQSGTLHGLDSPQDTMAILSSILPPEVAGKIEAILESGDASQEELDKLLEGTGIQVSVMREDEADKVKARLDAGESLEDIFSPTTKVKAPNMESMLAVGPTKDETIH